MTKFRFQINGTIQANATELKDVQEHLMNRFENENTKLTGVVVFEVVEKVPKPHYSGKGIGRKKGL